VNYIKQLQQELAREKAVTAATEAGLDALRSYLMSSKFHVDTTVQVSDVLHAIAGIRNSMTDARFENREPIAVLSNDRYAEERYRDVRTGRG
jgi:hypothetical protein